MCDPIGGPSAEHRHRLITVELGPYPVAPEGVTPDETELTAARLWERADGGEVGAVWQMTPGVLDAVQGEEVFEVVQG